MSNIKHSVEELIGNTPLLELDNYEKTFGIDARILVKVESLNPYGSLKDRIAVAMIDALEKNTDIKPGDYIVEASSGNTAIALAAIARKRGYKSLFIVEQMTDERYKLLEAYDAEIVEVADDPEMIQGMMNLNEDYMFHDFLNDYYGKKSKESDVNYFPVSQWANKANPQIQYETTGQEIIRDTDGKVDVFVSGIGSGGSIRGISDALREVNPDLEVVVFDSIPEEPDSLIGVHKVEGANPALFPLHVSEKPGLYNSVFPVTKEQAYQTANDVGKTEGIMFGVTTGAAVYLAAQLARKPEYAGKTILTIAYDDVTKYLTTDLIASQYRR